MAATTAYCPKCKEPLVLSSERVTVTEFDEVLGDHEVDCEIAEVLGVPLYPA